MASKIFAGLDLEMGKLTGYTPTGRRKKASRRTLWRTPISVGLGMLAIFSFFVVIGQHKSHPEDDKLVTIKADIGQPQLFKFAIMKEYDHDPEAFTQGLLYEQQCEAGGSNCKDIMYESTGLYGKSTVREVDLATGKVIRSKQLPSNDFGEGLTRLGDKLYQVTWKSPRTWTYNVDNFEQANLVKTPLKDGWGITSNGTHLIVGDSTEYLYFLDPKTMKVVQKLRVMDEDQPVRWINELEWIDNLIYGNIYQTDCIAQIDSQTGGIVGWVSMEGLKKHMIKTSTGETLAAAKRSDVLNGIAWDAKSSRLFVTGKQWPKMYQVELRPYVRDSTDPRVREVLAELRAKCILPGGSLG